MSRNLILTGALVLALIIGALTVGLLNSASLTPAQAASQDSPTTSQQTDIDARLAALHKRAADRNATDADDKYAQIENPALSGLAPEDAVALARQAAGGGRPLWIVRRTDSAG